MKPGDLVEFKAGLFGLKPPQNLGIYLERVKRKGSFFVVLHTLRGKQEVKAENLSSKKLSARVDAAHLTGDLGPRLKQLIEDLSKGKVKEEKAPTGEMDDRALWQFVKDADGEPLSPEAMAELAFDTKTPSRSMVSEVRRVLETCREPGIGYFERTPERAESWRPMTRAQHVSFHREKEGLSHLRKKLITVEEVEDEEGRLRTVYRPIEVADAALDDEDRRRLAFVGEVMRDFVLHDRFRHDNTVGASGKHTLDGFNLMTFLKWLAIDWTQAERVTTSSAFVEFLVDTDLLGLDDAVHLVAKRLVLRHQNFGWEVPPDVERAAERAPAEIPPEVLAQRVDLREQRCFTIDPPDARDHDDAVGVDHHEDGGATLWVHIADVSHYVTPESTLDHEARKRATSVYLPTGVLPMLPTRLSNNLCSLKENVDRLAMTVSMRYDANGNLVEEKAMETVIRVDANVSYQQVQDAIETGDASNEFVRMRRFADLLDKHRRGLAIETSERRVKLTPDNVEHVEKMGTPATRMIETFMVAANEAVARILTDAGVPALYRCHPLPDRSKVERFNGQCETMEVPVSIELPEPEKAPGADEDGEGGGMSLLDQLKMGKMSLSGGTGFKLEGFEPEPEEEAEEEEEPPAPAIKGLAQLTPEEQETWLKPFRDALLAVRDIENDAVKGLVFMKTLGCMGRAFYTPDNFGHFGLGSTCYAHFTSPIRRYPDLVVHRQLRWLLRGREGTMPHDRNGLDILAAHTSDQGYFAETLERGTVDAALVFASRAPKWAGAKRALITGLTKGGAFLTLEGGVEARVATSDIPGGPWNVDDYDSMLFTSSGERPEMMGEVTAKNWRELVDPESEEVKQVRLRLGDVETVHITSRDYVEGKVQARLGGPPAAEVAGDAAE